MQAFEWHEAKRRVAIEKHGLDFVDAVEVFSAPHLVVLAQSETEARQMASRDLHDAGRRLPHHHGKAGTTL